MAVVLRERSRTPNRHARSRRGKTPPKEARPHGRKDVPWRQRIEEDARRGSSLRITISNRCVKDLCSMLLDTSSFASKFRSITIENSGIGKEGARHIAELVKANRPGLERLDLRSNSIGAGLEFFQNALLGNRCLLQLCLDSNNITPKGVKQLCQGLHGNETLRVLELSDNPQIKDAGVLALVEQFLWPQRRRTNLSRLYLSGCLIQDDAARALSRIFNGEPPSRLIYLGLSNNDIGNYGAGSFQKPLQYHQNSLEELDLRDNNRISANKVADLRAAAGLHRSVRL